MKNYYFDMDGVIANFHKEPFKYTNAINRDWIANLEPFMNNIMIMLDLIKKGENVYILTKAICDNAKLGKIDFIKKYMPNFDIDNKFICIVGNGKKVDYIKTANGILVDDDMKNIRPWAKAGYEYIYIENKGDTAQI